MAASNQPHKSTATPREIESWKLELAQSRIRFFRIPKDDREDALHDLIVELIQHRFDPAQPNGAKESTAVFALIDNRLKMMLRSEGRARRRMEKYQAQYAAGSDEDTFLAVDDPTPLNIDVRSAVAGLEPSQRDIALRLARGQSIAAIARELGCGWHAVERSIVEIRHMFEAKGLDAWLGR